MSKSKSFQNKFSDASDLLQLPLFTKTLLLIIFQPYSFYKIFYNEIVSRPHNFGGINFSQTNSSILGPIKFSAYSIAISNLLFPVIFMLGGLNGAINPEYQKFAQWAEDKGYLGGPSFTGVAILDNALQDILILVIMYALGLLIYIYSSRKIPLFFATGYFFYLNSWSLVSSILMLGLVTLNFIFPVQATGLPFLTDFILYAVWIFFIVGFPILAWPAIISVGRTTIAFALGLGLVSWIIVIAITLPILVPMPDLSTYQGFNRPL